MKWPVEPLVNVCQIMMGQAPAGTSYNDAEKGVPLVAGAGDFNGTVPKVHKYTTAPSKVSNVGDIILGIRASIGEKVWSDQPYCLGRGVAGLRVKSNLSPWFLWHWLGLAKKELLSKARGATFLQVNRKDIESLQIPLPPLEEQKRIAKILDAVDALRAKRRESLTLLDKLIQSTFLDMFGDPVSNPMGWEMHSLEDVTIKITDGTHHSPPIVESGVPYITAKHLKKDGLIFFDNPWYVSHEDHAKIYSRCDPIKGDILYIKDGATTGIAAINFYNFPFSMLSSLALLRVKPEALTNYYICSLLNNDKKKSSIIGNMGGAAIKRLTLSKIKKISIPIPPLPIQQRFASIVESIEKQKTRLKVHLSELDTLFASLQSRAFQGEL